jgi:cysteine desulfurase
MQRFYLDDNATTNLDPRVRAVMEPLLAAPFVVLGNPSSLHAEGRRARGEIDAARDSIAAWLKAKPSEIIFTSGGTESCNLAVQGLAHGGKGKHLVTAKTEHHAVLHACRALEMRHGFEVTYLDVDAGGLVDPDELARAIRPDTILVSIMSANNETGVRQPMREIGEICAKRKVLFHTDAIQSAGKEEIDLAGWQVSALSLTAHKFHGPLGAGLLWLKTGVPIARLMEGGSHENERRPGTENAPAIAGFAEAARLYGKADPVEAERQFRWTERLWQELNSLGGVRRNGTGTPDGTPDSVRRLPNTLNVSFLGLHGEDFLIGLDLAGLAVSSGSACLVGSVQPSHVLAAMGVPADWASATVRFSIGPQIHDEDGAEIARRVKEVVTHQRALRGWTSGAFSEQTKSQEILV